MRYHIRILVPLVSLFLLSACGPVKEETWNSYYYGTHRASTVFPQDNDDTYVIPSGSWQDNQTPQGMKW